MNRVETYRGTDVGFQIGGEVGGSTARAGGPLKEGGWPGDSGSSIVKMSSGDDGCRISMPKLVAALECAVKQVFCGAFLTDVCNNLDADVSFFKIPLLAVLMIGPGISCSSNHVACLFNISFKPTSDLENGDFSS